MSAQPLPIGASGMGIDNTKVTFFFIEYHFVWQSKRSLSPDLTLLNINISKASNRFWRIQVTIKRRQVTIRRKERLNLKVAACCRHTNPTMK